MLAHIVREPHCGDAENNPGSNAASNATAPIPTAVTAMAVPEIPLWGSLVSTTASSTNSIGGEARSTFTVLRALLSSCMKTPARLGNLRDGDSSR